MLLKCLCHPLHHVIPVLVASGGTAASRDTRRLCLLLTPQRQSGSCEAKPGGFAQTSCQVCHRGVAGDNQIAVGDDGSILQEIPDLTDLILATDETILERTGFKLLTAKPFWSESKEI